MTNPPARSALITVIMGLGAGGLILFRQTRKTAKSLITSEARAKYAAPHDERTHLPNKSLLLDRLKAIPVAEGGDVGVMCIGLDRFEEVSEVLGYEAGDEVIAEIAARLLSICREHDTIARIGDDVLELKVIAEGVETRAQVDRLMIAGCTQIQGFFYSRPIDAAAISDLITGRMKLAA